jgi:hypothetical protein
MKACNIAKNAFVNMYMLGSEYTQLFWNPCHIASGRPQQKTPFPNNSCIVIEVCLPRRCTQTAVLLLLLACSFPREPVYGAVAYQ